MRTPTLCDRLSENNVEGYGITRSPGSAPAGGGRCGVLPIGHWAVTVRVAPPRMGRTAGTHVACMPIGIGRGGHLSLPSCRGCTRRVCATQGDGWHVGLWGGERGVGPHYGRMGHRAGSHIARVACGAMGGVGHGAMGHHASRPLGWHKEGLDIVCVAVASRLALGDIGMPKGDFAPRPKIRTGPSQGFQARPSPPAVTI